jgi:pyruvate,orthophosphate dikinase
LSFSYVYIFIFQMDTVLNLGLNDKVVEGLAKKTGNPRFAWDSYRRLLDMFGDVVLSIPHSHFEHKLNAMKLKKGVKEDSDLSVDDLKELVAQYKDIYKLNNFVFPEGELEQLKLASTYK